MSEDIEIVNGVVSLVQRQVIKSVPYGAFARMLARKAGSRTPFLPPGVVLHGERDKTSLFVLEQAPTVRNIQHRYVRTKEPAPYTIALPWVYLVMTFNYYSFDGLRVYFAKRRLHDECDTLCYAPLPNLYPDGRACLGDLSFQVTSSVTSRIVKAAELFWQGVFNTDLSTLYERHMPQSIKDLTAGPSWFEGWSKVPAADICSLNWVPYDRLENVVDGTLGEEDEDA